MQATSPQDPSKKPVAKRRRAALSCAECRRLKLKCDRSVPCSSCVKRGCSSLCPTGQLVPGKGTRYILTNTEELHQKIDVLSERIRYLESALAVANGSSPTLGRELEQAHPHLNEMLEGHNMSLTSEEDIKGEFEDVQDSLGTLIIGEGGHTRWLGATASSETFLQHDADEEDTKPTLIELEDADGFPFSMDLSMQRMDKEALLRQLPPYEQASSLVEVYLAHAGWLYQPFARSELFTETLKPAYRDDRLSIPSSNLALLCIVLALGILVDLTRQPNDPAARKFYALSRRALTMDDFFVQPTFATIQTLHTMSLFLQMTNDSNDPAASVVLTGITIKLAQSMGLHRDPARWGTMSDQEICTRRRLWWEVVTADAWQSLTFGRPAGAFRPHFDCEHPLDTEENLGTSPLFQKGKFLFTEFCLLPVLDQAMAVTPPTYANVLQLDIMIRDWDCPARLELSLLVNEPINFAFSLQRYMMFSVREASLLYLHRTYCSRALREHPMNPLKSRYAPSFVAAYRSAVNVLLQIRRLYSEQPALMLRFWTFATHSTSAAILLGAIVSQSPGSQLAESALLELDYACQFFEKARSNSRIARALPTIMILKQKSHHAIERYRAGLWTPPINGSRTHDDEHAPGIITGTKVVNTHKRTLAAAANTNSPKPTGSTPSSAGSNDFEMTDNLHPTLAEYFQLFQQPDYLVQLTQISHSAVPQPQKPVTEVEPQLSPTPWANMQMPQLLAPVDPMIMSSYIPPTNTFVDEFAPVDDTMVTQPMNEEWNRFMRQL